MFICSLVSWMPRWWLSAAGRWWRSPRWGGSGWWCWCSSNSSNSSRGRGQRQALALHPMSLHQEAWTVQWEAPQWTRLDSKASTMEVIMVSSMIKSSVLCPPGFLSVTLLTVVLLLYMQEWTSRGSHHLWLRVAARQGTWCKDEWVVLRRTPWCRECRAIHREAPCTHLETWKAGHKVACHATSKWHEQSYLVIKYPCTIYVCTQFDQGNYEKKLTMSLSCSS